MALGPLRHSRVRIIDIDGTVVNWRAPEDYFTIPQVALSGAVEKVNKWHEKGDYIIFWTARVERLRDKTIDMLDRLGFKYHGLICGKPYSHDIHIYDDNPIISHKVTRNKGIGDLDD
jgi:hypothetical protein